MSGANSFGRSFCVTTFGESHGPAIGCVIDGCPPGVPIAPEDFRADLDRRATGRSRHTSQRREADEVEILSGVYQGLSTGTPIALLIRNTDARSKDYGEIAERFRPGHADYTYWHKYGIRDPRGGGRASARETTLRVAAAVLAKKLLTQRGIRVQGWLSGLGPYAPARIVRDAVERNPLFWPDPEQLPELEAFLDGLRKSGDSIGARLTVIAEGVPVGLGEPVYGKLDAEIAAALMSINAVKAVEIGDGADVCGQRGSEPRDELTRAGFLSNHAGGILGGISTGQAIIAHAAIKPTCSILVPGRTLDVHGNEVEIVTKGRHDPCVGIRAVPIVEAMLALVLVDHLLRHRAQCADVPPQQPLVPADPFLP
ncbi:MAG: chorismate synthase [Xanthomonadales bacterium]|nr:chorismate synthase [Xanthomonadales bacterium]